MPTLRTPLKYALLGAFWIIFLLGYFAQVPIPGFLVTMVALATALLAALAALGWGIWLVRRLWPEADQPAQALEFVIFSLGLGWGVISLAMVAFGVIGLWTAHGAQVLIIGGLILAFAHYFKYPPKTISLKGKSIPYLWILAPLVGLSLLLALAPITYYDSLVYHLALPAAYIRAGQWIGWQDLVYSAFPQNLEMLWTWGLLLGGPALPNLIGWCMAMTLVAAVGAWGRRFLDAKSAAAAMALLLGMPAFLFLSSGGYVDIGLSFYVFLSVYALSLNAYALAGLFVGLALGVKYTGGTAAVLGGLWILAGGNRSPLSERCRAAGAYSLAAFAVFAPWLFKNLHYTGNPVFSFLYTWGKQDLNPWMQAGAAGYFRGLVEYAPHSLFEIPGLLWNVVAQGLRFGGGSDILGDFGWAPLVMLLPLCAFTKPAQPLLRRIALYVGLFFIGWGMSRPVLRFLLPIAPLLAVLAGYGWTQGLAQAPQGLRWAARAVIGLLGLSSFLLFFQIADIFQPFRVPLRLQTPSEYLRQKLTYYGAAEFINKTTDGDTSVIVVGDQRSYYYLRHVTVWTVFNRNPVVDWADQAASPQALREQLRRQGRLLVVNRAEMQRLGVYHALDFSAAGQKNWEGMLHGLKPVYQDTYCDVYPL